jgi:uncharacterized membrane protein
MIAVLGGAPFLLSLEPDRYVPAHKFMVTRFDPFMPICMMSALIFDVVMSVVAPGAGYRALFVTAVVFLLGAMVVSLTKNVPINRWVAALDPDFMPADFSKIDPRVRWSTWNRIRTVFVLCALADTAAAAGLLL